jgi:hypothetical protein
MPHALDGDETAHTFAADVSKGNALGDISRYSCSFGQVLSNKGKEAAATTHWQNAQFVASQQEWRKVLGGVTAAASIVVIL